MGAIPSGLALVFFTAAFTEQDSDEEVGLDEFEQFWLGVFQYLGEWLGQTFLVDLPLVT